MSQVVFKIKDQNRASGAVDSPSRGSGELQPSSSTCKEHRDSLKQLSPSSTDDVRRRWRGVDGEESTRALLSSDGATGSAASASAAGGAEVLVCSGNGSFRHRSRRLSKSRTNSRLMDSPASSVDRRSGRAAKYSRGLGGKPVSGDPNQGDETRSLDEDDIPEEYRRMELSKFTALQLASLASIVAALACSLAVPAIRRLTLWDLPLWKWEAMLLALICGRLLSGWGIRVAVFFIERNFLLRKRVLYFVYGLKKAVQDCLWLGLVLLAWNTLFDDRVEEETRSRVLPFVTKVLVCCLVTTVIWLLKTLGVKVLALSFHVATFFDRIQESLFNQYVIETLSMPPVLGLGHECRSFSLPVPEEEEKGGYGAKERATIGSAELRAGSPCPTRSGGVDKSPKVGKSPRFFVDSNDPDEEITIDHLHKLNQNNISAWNMKRLMNIVRHGTLYTLDERIFNSQQSHVRDDSSLEIRTECQARKAAKKIFQNVAKLGSQYIYLEDLMCFMREDEALKTMRLFEGVTEAKGISKASLKNWMVDAFRERRALALSLNDTHTAVDELHHMLSVLVAIIIMVVWLLILEVKIKQFFVFVSSQLLLMKFVFGNMCKTVFEAIIFIFVIHPFDVGDRCEVEGVQMVVEEMNILTTVFLRYDNQKIIYPNSYLSTVPISNYYRSPDMGDSVEFSVHIATPFEKISSMKERIKRYIECKSDHWCPDPMIIMKDVKEFNSINMGVYLTHKMNHQNIWERWTRRALLVEEMVGVFRELDIEYRLLPLDVNISKFPDSTDSTTDRVPSNWEASKA